MRWVRPNVFLTAQTRTNPTEMRAWLESLNVPDARISEVTSTAKTDGERIVEGAGRRCYMSFEVGMNPNVTQIRKEISEYIENILKVGHGSVIEHVNFTFAIENVSRVFTGEMNRHRAGMAISEGSMRFIRFNDIPMCEVPSLRLDGVDESTQEFLKRKLSRDIFSETVAHIEKAYRDLTVGIWAEELAPESKFKNKKNVTSMLRRIVPMGVATGGKWTGNLRALRHIFNMRCAESAEEEILEVAGMMLLKMRDAEPNFFKDFERVEGFWTPKYRKV